jgi:WhiB family transcriptional regulator, redox-sensing transcriptional regulator
LALALTLSLTGALTLVLAKTLYGTVTLTGRRTDYGPRDADFCTFSDSRRPILVTWRDRAACLDENPELFFPTGNADPAFRQIEQAKLVCRRCEVVQTCLRWAIDSLQDAGVWGGLSEDERQALKR